MLLWRRKKMSRFSPRGIKGLTWIESNWRIVGFWKEKKKKQVSFSRLILPPPGIKHSSKLLTSLGKANNDNKGKKCVWFFSFFLSKSFTHPANASKKFHPEKEGFHKLYWLYVDSTIRGQWQRCFCSVYQFVRMRSFSQTHLVRHCIVCFSSFWHVQIPYTWEIIEFQLLQWCISLSLLKTKFSIVYKTDPHGVWWWPVDIIRCAIPTE